ncbi:MAG: DNA methyltransferase, partial [Kiritimatiellia bacterium]
DPKKIHYIKAVMDEVFGETNFRNEIIWKRSSVHSDSKTFSNLHDVLLFYTKSDNFQFFEKYTDYDEKYILSRYKHVEINNEGKERRFLDRDLSATGLSGGGY